MNIFVGNLSKDVSENDLEKLFSTFGSVKNTKVISDLFSGSSKGFGFVEMGNQNEAVSAINELNTHELKGQKITVNEARPQKNNMRGSRNRNVYKKGKRPGGFGGNRRY